MHTDKISGRVFFFILAVSLMFCSLSQNGLATFFGEVKTGLQNVSDDHDGYSLFVPAEYNADHEWPLVMALHDEGSRGEEYIQSWVEAAKARGMFVFCPTYQMPEGGTPYEHDKRLIQLKHDIENQYEIDPNRILVVGFGTGGHYAFYLALQYPNEFSGVASIGNPVPGNLKKLFNLSYAGVNQLPVLILVSHEDEIQKSDDTMAELDSFRARGYRIETVEAEHAKDIKNPTANSHILEWFHQVGAEREKGFEGRSREVKQKFYKWVDHLLQNR
jgi:predicted peptidase